MHVQIAMLKLTFYLLFLMCVYKALTMHPTMSKQGNDGLIHSFSSVSDN